jgi:L-aminopeptidase/D-esterase-like protein
MHTLKVGHYTNHTHATGVSVFILDRPSPAVYSVLGASPASHELHVLELEGNVPYIDGILFSGGSAFGLNSVAGVMKWFQEQGRGYQTPHAVVPIVPAAGIYDLAVTSAIPPTPEEAYEACLNAVENNVAQGRIGAGTGASVGKLVPHAHRMSGGIGYSEMNLTNGVSVVAYAVVNSLGDVRDQQGNIIAGARLENGEFADCERYLLTGHKEVVSDLANTTLVAVFTNAKFSKIELKRITKVASAGMARAVSPVFTRDDGDIIFCASIGERHALEMIVGTMAAEVVRMAIVNAVKDSITL